MKLMMSVWYDPDLCVSLANYIYYDDNRGVIYSHSIWS